MYRSEDHTAGVATFCLFTCFPYGFRFFWLRLEALLILTHKMTQRFVHPKLLVILNFLNL
jgi:hypothetical protein